MSFIRAGEQGSSIYAYPAEATDGREVYICCGALDTIDEMHDHFIDHIEDGDVVPDEAFDRLDDWANGIMRITSRDGDQIREQTISIRSIREEMG